MVYMVYKLEVCLWWFRNTAFPNDQRERQRQQVHLCLFNVVWCCAQHLKKQKMRLAFNSNGKPCGTTELRHKIKVLQKANSCNSEFFSSVHPFLHLSGIFFFLRFSECSLSGCIYLRLTLTASNLDFSVFFFFFFSNSDPGQGEHFPKSFKKR